MVNPRFKFAVATAASAVFTAASACGLLLDFVVKLALGNRVRFRQRGVAVHVDLCESELRLCLAQLTLRLLKGRLERAGIDLEQDLPLLNLRTFAIILADEIPVRLGLNLRVHVSVKCANPFTGYGHITLRSAYDRDLHRWTGAGGRSIHVVSASREHCTTKNHCTRKDREQTP